jgi:hypothetical protein
MSTRGRIRSCNAPPRPRAANRQAACSSFHLVYATTSTFTIVHSSPGKANCQAVDSRGVLHRELYYLSDRLATDLVHQAQAAKKARWRPSVVGTGSGFPLSVSLSRENPDLTNRHVLANEALSAAADEAGSLADPGRYIYLSDFPFSLWVFSFKATPNKPIAVALCTHPLEGALLVLVGSARNVFGYSSELPIDGWIPSDPEGLRELGRFGRDADLDPAIAELMDPRINHASAAFWGEDPPDLVTDAACIAMQLTRTPDRAGSAEILAKVHEYRDDVHTVLPVLGYNRVVPRVIVGAPVVIREAAPIPLV